MIQWAAERLISFLPEIARLKKEDKKESRDIADNALRAISIALDETSIYSKRLRQGAKHDEDIEEQLAKYWSAAAIPMRHLDPELAEICAVKSTFWIDPEAWDESNQVAIDVNSVREAYRKNLLSS